MVAMGIHFTADTMLASAPSSHSSCSTSLETDVLMADISLLPSSVGSAGDLVKRTGTEAAMEVSIMASTDTPSEAPTEGTVIDQKEKDNA